MDNNYNKYMQEIKEEIDIPETNTTYPTLLVMLVVNCLNL